ncbi:MAG: ABC transporter permease [Coriobacteriia bacterium]|nr:ABC transporter permease [Coriobacteriia bacterium]
MSNRRKPTPREGAARPVAARASGASYPKNGKTALWKDVWRSIAHSKGRFVSIMLLMALGSFALVGLFVAGPDMRATGEAYFGEYSLADLTVLSDYGLDDDDVAAINQASGTTAIEYGYFKDVTVDGSTDAVRVMSMPDEVSQLELVDGRMPERAGEIAVDTNVGEQYAIGSTIRVSEKANAISDETCLNDTEYTVVGHVHTPEIISIVNMGQSTAGTGSLKGYAVVVDDEFDSDVYMTARMTFEDTEGLDPYSNEYRDRVQDHKSEVEGLIADRPAARLATVVADAQVSIDDGQAEVDDAKQRLADAKETLDDAAQTLADAAEQLADGQAEIDDAEARITDGEAQIADAQGQIDESQATLDAAAATIADGEAQLAAKAGDLRSAESRLTAAKSQLDAAKATLDEKAPQVAAAEAQLPAAKQRLAEGQRAYDEGAAQLEEAKAQVQAYDDGRAQLDAAYAELDAGQAEVDAGRAELAEKTAELDAVADQAEAARAMLEKLDDAVASATQQVSESEARVVSLQEQIAAETNPVKKAALEAELVAAQAKLQAQQAYLAQLQAKAATDEVTSAREQVARYDAGRASVAEATARLDEAQRGIDAGRAEADEKKAQLDAVAEQVEAGRAAIPQKEQELAAAKEQLDAAAAQIAAAEAGIASYYEGIATYQQGLATYAEGLQSYETGRAAFNAAADQLASGKAEYASGAATLAAARETLASKVDELASAKTQVAEAKQTLAEKLAEYNDGLSEYEDGLAEYNDELPDAQRKIADGESDLADARARLAKLSTPVYEADTRRETLGSEAYKTYDTVSEIIDSLATVFPVLLYLVAAFVTLSTITRMVEEERINSGTLKALGYRDGDVALKFVLYGALAGGIGSVAGIALGHTLLPYIVYNAYGAKFTLPPIHLGFYPVITLVAIVLAGLCAVLPAGVAVRRELGEKPAALLLPKPPSGGSKIMLERIAPLWSRMSFTHKVTARNLFRYKQRMLMTILGVAGATCMLVAGFGVQHSIQEMASKQFGAILKYDMIVAQNSTATDDQLAELDDALAGDEVASEVALHYESVSLTAGANNDKQEITLLVPEQSSDLDEYLDLHDRKSGEKLELEGDGAVISERLATLLGVGVGDEVEFTASDGSSRTVRVSGVCEMYMGHFMVMSHEAYESCYGEGFEANAAMVRLKDGTLSSVENAASGFMELKGVKSVVQNTTLQSQVDTVVTSLNKIMGILILVASMLAVVIMYNLTNINVSERMRELSTIKVLGFHSNETTMYIYRETIILTALGLVAGWLLGIALHQYILNVVPPDNVMFNPALAPIEFIVPAVVISAITVVLYFVELRRLSTVDMLEALKSVE